MHTDSGNTTSCWMDTIADYPDIAQYPPLSSNEDSDVCVIGAGIAGLTTAYLLTQAGKRVIVLDDGPVGGGESAHTTAHLVTALDDRFFELERLHGAHGAQLAAESHAAAIDMIESIAIKENIDCDFTRLDGYLFLAGDRAIDIDILQRELAAAHRAGLLDVTLETSVPVHFFNSGPCLRFPQQGQIHPLKYLLGLASSIVAGGGVIHTGTHATNIKSGTPGQVTTDLGHTITCRSIVVATNTPVNDLVVIHTKQTAYRSYVIALRVPRGSIYKALYWDTLDPYHYVRLAEANDKASELLIVGGEDHKTGQEDDAELRFAHLEEWARARFPMAQELAFRWSGQVMEPLDGLAFIGANPLDKSGIYIATGDSGNGMTHGTIAGMLLTDLITGKPNPWTTLYNPNRVSLRSAKEYTQEVLNMAAQYGDWVTEGDVESENEIALASGAIIRHGMQKYAVYRDESGALHQCKAECPHLGGIVAWNSVEKTWDCPVHGSRFDCYGKVVNGPSISNMTPAELTLPSHPPTSTSSRDTSVQPPR